mmetsp:Transcript_37306/g.87811  ORF Transcript_37306/g.87811 Transcript_37306/m.87811 type:complete len:130 (-) Transcript_37306:126-515(-)|eukprot:scaffold54697_cov70-Phaeocystis_antarctica.AAC.6
MIEPGVEPGVEAGGEPGSEAGSEAGAEAGGGSGAACGIGGCAIGSGPSRSVVVVAVLGFFGAEWSLWVLWNDIVRGLNVTPETGQIKGRGCSFKLRSQTQPMAQAQAISEAATTNITITESAKPLGPPF